MADRAGQRRQVESEIEQAALRLVAARGLDGVTVDEIAAAAGVSPRTFFRYFQFKIDVVLAYYRRRQSQMVEALAARPPHEPPHSALKHALLSVIAEGGDDDHDVAQLRQRVRAQIPGWAMGSAAATSRGQMVQLVALRLGVDPTIDIRPSVFVDSAVAAANAAHDLWLAEDCEPDLVAIATDALETLEIGFRAVSAEVSRHASWRTESNVG